MEVCFVYRCNFKSPFRTRKEIEIWYLLRSSTLIFSALARCLGRLGETLERLALGSTRDFELHS